MPVDTAVQRLKLRRTKIVATLGPASDDVETLEALIRAGTDVFRLNFSHGTHEGHRETYRRVRDAAARLGASVAVLGDLCGPKLRTGTFRGGRITLEKDAPVTVTVRDVEGAASLIPSTYRELARDVQPGSRILLDDGNLELRVESVEGTEIRCAVVAGGTLADRKGINLPGVAVSAPALTAKDREDAALALDLGVDLLALSFVRRPEDLVELRSLVADAGGSAHLLAKIEKPEALDTIDGIVDASDGIMVARGDLGVELPPEAVPIVQSQLVDLARAGGKPVIVATQMLQSMVDTPRPTRAEATDVSSAVQSGADAVMLSAETAVGAHPVGAVKFMDRLARETEGYMWRRGAFASMTPTLSSERAFDEPLPVEGAVARAASQLSRDLLVRAVVVFTHTGRSAAVVASFRPQAPVLAVSDRIDTCRRLKLLWGVVPVHLPTIDSLEALHDVARALARERGLARAGEHVLHVRGFHAESERSTPTLSVLTA